MGVKMWVTLIQAGLVGVFGGQAARGGVGWGRAWAGNL